MLGLDCVTNLPERNFHPTCQWEKCKNHLRSLDMHLWLIIKTIRSSSPLICFQWRWGKPHEDNKSKMERSCIHSPITEKNPNTTFKLIFASINRKDESTLLKDWGHRSVPPCISNRGHRWVTGIPLRSFSSMLRLNNRAISLSVSNLICHFENTPSAISNSDAPARDPETAFGHTYIAPKRALFWHR